MKKLLLLGTIAAGLLLAGCGEKKVVDPIAASCPERTVSMVQANQRFLDQVVPGQTPAAGLRDLNGLKRKATLEKPGEAPMLVAFFQTGLPQCPWVMAVDSLTPVVIKDGVIVKVGVQNVRDMAAEGWVLKEAAWPWQRYDFGYIPGK